MENISWPDHRLTPRSKNDRSRLNCPPKSSNIWSPATTKTRRWKRRSPAHLLTGSGPENGNRNAPRKPPGADRVPQRFAYWVRPGQYFYGCCFPQVDTRGRFLYWYIREECGGFATFNDNPWETMGQVIGDDVAGLHWIDNEYGWRPLGADDAASI